MTPAPGSTFLSDAPASSRLARSFWWLVTIALGAALLVAGASYGAPGLRELFDRRAPMYRLSHSWWPRGADAALRGSGWMLGPPSAVPPICRFRVDHLLGSNNGSAHWSQGTERTRVEPVTIEFSSSLSTPDEATIPAGEPVLLDPSELHEVFEPDATRYRAAFGLADTGGRLMVRCVHRSERVFVDGCFRREGRLLTGCPGAPLTVTVGDGTAQPRVDDHAALVALRLAGMAGAATLALALALLRRLTRATPAATALAGPTPDFARGGRVTCAAALPLLLLVARWAQVGGFRDPSLEMRLGYVAGLAVAVAAGLLAVLAWRHRDGLDRALAAVDTSPLRSLREASAGVTTFVVTAEGATATGLLDERAHAWVGARLVESVERRSGRVTRWSNEPGWPTRVAVRDASGVGALDLTHAALDLPPSAWRHWNEAGLWWTEIPARLRSRLPEPPPTPLDGHRQWRIEEGAIDAGDALVVIGRATRVTRAEGEGPYRDEPTMTLLTGSPGAPLVVHRGTVRSLRAALRWERAGVAACAAAAVALAGALTLAMLWLAWL